MRKNNNNRRVLSRGLEIMAHNMSNLVDDNFLFFFFAPKKSVRIARKNLHDFAPHPYTSSPSLYDRVALGPYARLAIDQDFGRCQISYDFTSPFHVHHRV